MSIRAPEFTSTNNPSKRSRMKRRGPKKHFYTVKDIARLVGLADSSVRVYASSKDPHRRFDMDDLGSVFAFVQRYRKEPILDCPGLRSPPSDEGIDF